MSAERQTSVLLVEDVEDELRTMEKILESGGYRVTTAHDGHGALAAYRSARPDVVVTDIFMPVADGLELIQEVLKVESKAKILCISGGGARRLTSMLNVAHDLGAEQTLVKPFSAEELLAAVGNLVSENS